MLTNYLYDKFKKPDSKTIDVEALLQEHEVTIAKLESMIASSDDHHPSSELKFHKETLQRIRAADPSIAAMVEDTMQQLERYGQSRMEKHLKKYRP